MATNKTAQSQAKKEMELVDAFESAQTSNEMLNLLKQMESLHGFDDQVLGYASYQLSHHLRYKDRNHKKALTFADKSLKIFDRDGFFCPLFDFPSLLQLLASIHISMKRFNDSLPFLIRARDMLLVMIRDKDDDEGSYVVDLLNVDRWLIQVYSVVLNFKQALVFCLETLEFREKKKKLLEGKNSEISVACDRVMVGVVYKELGQYEKALEENALARRFFKDSSLKGDLLLAEIEAADVMIAVGRYDEALASLNNIVQQARVTGGGGTSVLFALIAMAKAFCNRGDIADCKRYLETCREVIDRVKSVFPSRCAEAYSKTSEQYETMNEFETVICLLKKALALLEKLPYEQHSVGKASAKIGSLLLRTGEVEEAVTYLESAAKSLNYSLGPKHIQVGYNYNNLGAAYSKLGKPQSAVQMFAVAKDIMDVCLASDHVDTIEACQNLAKAYGEMGSYSIAIDFQQVINAWESHGASGEDKLREAHQLLEELKKNASGFYANESPEKTLPRSHAPAASRSS